MTGAGGGQPHERSSAGDPLGRAPLPSSIGDRPAPRRRPQGRFIVAPALASAVAGAIEFLALMVIGFVLVAIPMDYVALYALGGLALVVVSAISGVLIGLIVGLPADLLAARKPVGFRRGLLLAVTALGPAGTALLAVSTRFSVWGIVGVDIAVALAATVIASFLVWRWLRSGVSSGSVVSLPRAPQAAPAGAPPSSSDGMAPAVSPYGPRLGHAAGVGQADDERRSAGPSDVTGRPTDPSG